MHPDQRDPEAVVWPSGLLEAWGATAEKQHIFKKQIVFWPCLLLDLCSGKCVDLRPCHPRPPKKHVAEQSLRDAYDWVPEGSLAGNLWVGFWGLGGPWEL